MPEIADKCHSLCNQIYEGKCSCRGETRCVAIEKLINSHISYEDEMKRIETNRKKAK